MTNLIKFAAGTALALALSAQPSLAQTKKAAPTVAAATAAAPRGAAVQGIGVADMQVAVANTNAYRTASQQRQTSYKATYDAAQARAKQVDAQLQPLIAAFNADRAAKKPDATLQQQYAAVQAVQAQGEADIKQILQPAQLSDEYVIEQVTEKLPQAVNTVMGRRGVTLLLNPDSVILAGPAYDLTSAVVAELNTLVPSAQVVPPAGWVPRRVREQQAQQAGRTGAAPAAVRPAAPQPDGR